ncbi:MAG TPA: hypothetical protein VEL11_18545 [Candidatus Bathyarchaeia archaeon]|nr:hypothetical protein [Candidatus Bathyarchaeia archaeon]
MTRPTYGNDGRDKVKPEPKADRWKCLCGACYNDSTTADRHYNFYHGGVHDDDLKKR